MSSALIDFVKWHTEPNHKPPFGYSIRELLEKGHMPEVNSWGTLDLSNKNIVSLDGLHLVPNIEIVCRLRLSNNNIKNIHGYFDRLRHLEALWLDGNQITDAVGAFSRFSKLQRLSLRDNNIAVVKGALAHLESLESLELSNNQIEDVENEFDVLLAKQELRDLALDGNKLSQRYVAYVESIIDQREAEREEI